jgi:hypothetical protein
MAKYAILVAVAAAPTRQSTSAQYGIGWRESSGDNHSMVMAMMMRRDGDDGGAEDCTAYRLNGTETATLSLLSHTLSPLVIRTLQDEKRQGTRLSNSLQLDVQSIGCGHSI